jgi:hypothetical protein
MPELPDRPDLDQLRRQARELLRAAANGEPAALASLGAVSERVTLSVAQLALAREYGYRSWSTLKAAVVERRRLAPAATTALVPGGEENGSRGAPRLQWSFGDGAAISSCVGVLSLETVAVSGEGLQCRAVLHASLAPSEDPPIWPTTGSRRLPAPGMLFARWIRPSQHKRIRQRLNDPTQATMQALIQSRDIMVADNEGIRYEVRGMSMPRLGTPEARLAGPVPVGLTLDPVPGRHVAWLEVCGIDRSWRAHAVAR